MHVGPRRRLVNKVLSECLWRIRSFHDCDEEEFAERIHDLPALLREAADQMETPPPGVAVRVEPPEFEGYSLWAENYDREEHNPVIAGEEEVIWDMIGDAQALGVLDVGCGTGRHALRLAEQGAQVVGLEPSPGMLARARAEARDKGLDVDLREGAIDALHAGLGQFDLVLCCLVLSHVSDLAAAIGKLAARVRPGGRLIVSDFHPFNILIGFRTSFRTHDEKYVLPNFVHLPSEYFNAMGSAGLRPTRLFERGGVDKFPGLPLTLIMAAHRPS